MSPSHERLPELNQVEDALRATGFTYLYMSNPAQPYQVWARGIRDEWKVTVDYTNQWVNYIEIIRRRGGNIQGRIRIDSCMNTELDLLLTAITEALHPEHEGEPIVNESVNADYSTARRADTPSQAGNPEEGA